MSAVPESTVPLPSPVPRSTAVRLDGGRDHPPLAVAPAHDPAGRDRPARDPARWPSVDDVHPGPRSVGPYVRLAPRVEPPAEVLPADGPAHRTPPVLGSPEALARPRPVTPGAPSAPAEAPGPLPDPTRLCCAMAQAAVEGLRGTRPLAQLTRWVSPDVFERLTLRAQLVQGSGVPTQASGRSGIRRVRVFRIGDGAAEASVVVDDGARVRAVAVRLEAHRGRWRATALEIG